MNDAEHRLTDLIDRWKIDAYPAADLMPSVERMPAFLADVDAALRELRQTRTGLDGTMAERDRAQAAADKLAYAIAPVEVIGEHSSGNDPWAEALEVLNERKAHDEDARLDGEPVHGWFGLSYSSYQVLPRVLMQSMPPAWQRQMVGLLEQLRDAFGHLEQAEAYDVQAAIEVEASSLTGAQRKATGVTEGWEGDEEDGEFVYHDANGDELESWSRVLVRVAEPLPPYNRGRTRIPLRKSEPVELVSGQGVLPVEAEAVCGFRVGDLVQITARDGEGEHTAPGLRLVGRTGVVAEIDDNPEYSIGISVEGWLGPVWCSSDEIRHADAAQDAPAETAGSAL